MINQKYLNQFLLDGRQNVNRFLNTNTTWYPMYIEETYDWLKVKLRKNDEFNLRASVQRVFSEYKHNQHFSGLFESRALENLAVRIRFHYLNGEGFVNFTRPDTLELIKHALFLLYKENWFSRKREGEKLHDVNSLHEYAIRAHDRMLYSYNDIDITLFEDFIKFTFPIVKDWLSRDFNKVLFAQFGSHINDYALWATVRRFDRQDLYSSLHGYTNKIYKQMGGEFFFGLLFRECIKVHPIKVTGYGSDYFLCTSSYTYIISLVLQLLFLEEHLSISMTHESL